MTCKKVLKKDNFIRKLFLLDKEYLNKYIISK